MAVGFPAKTTYANGDVFSASDINDTNGTLNLINPTDKGSIVSASAANTPARLAVGSNTAVLTADSTASTGLAWDGVWTNFTPSFTGVTVGNGTLVARYRKVGKTVELYVKLTLGSTSSLSGSLNYFALPFNLAYSGDGSTCSGGIQDVSPATNFISGPEFNGNNIILTLFATNTTWLINSRVTSTNPFTWTTGDYFWLQATYEAA
jgi:hypothetical protein